MISFRRIVQVAVFLAFVVGLVGTAERLPAKAGPNICVQGYIWIWVMEPPHYVKTNTPCNQ